MKIQARRLQTAVLCSAPPQLMKLLGNVFQLRLDGCQAFDLLQRRRRSEEGETCSTRGYSLFKLEELQSDGAVTEHTPALTSFAVYLLLLHSDRTVCKTRFDFRLQKTPMRCVCFRELKDNRNTVIIHLHAASEALWLRRPPGSLLEAGVRRLLCVNTKKINVSFLKT